MDYSPSECTGREEIYKFALEVCALPISGKFHIKTETGAGEDEAFSHTCASWNSWRPRPSVPMLVSLPWRDAVHLLWPGRLLGSVFVNACRWQLPLVMPPFSQTLLCKQHGSVNIRPCHKSLKNDKPKYLASREVIFVPH